MEDLLLRARVVIRTSKVKIPGRCWTDYVKNLHQKACGTCSTIIFPRSVNQIIDLWCCGSLCCRCSLKAAKYEIQKPSTCRANIRAIYTGENKTRLM